MKLEYSIYEGDDDEPKEVMMLELISCSENTPANDKLTLLNESEIFKLPEGIRAFVLKYQNLQASYEGVLKSNAVTITEEVGNVSTSPSNKIPIVSDIDSESDDETRENKKNLQ